MSSDEWVFVYLISIVGVAALYGTALYIGNYYALANFRKMETNNPNKFKM